MTLERAKPSRLVWECVVIVIGILIAFAIDAWWEESEERSDAEILLGGFAVELEANLDTVQNRLTFREEKRNSILRL